MSEVFSEGIMPVPPIGEIDKAYIKKRQQKNEYLPSRKESREIPDDEHVFDDGTGKGRFFDARG